MSGNFKKEDLRVIKTQKAFQNAIKSLLARCKFKQITVNDLCEEALTSRAAFYTHFKDKYDLLDCCFSSLLVEMEGLGTEKVINRFVCHNPKILQNVLQNADSETLGLFHNFLHSVLDNHLILPDAAKKSPKYIILSDFYVGGIFNIISRQIEREYPLKPESIIEVILNLLKNYSYL